MNTGFFGPSGPDLWVRIRGRTVGAIVCIGFGEYSLYWWNVATNGGRKAWLYAITLISAALLAWSISQLIAFRYAPRPMLSTQLKRFYRVWFSVIVATEVAAIVLGAPILAHLQRSDLYANWVDGVVGLHFFPLGKLFKLPVYYATGAVISLAALGSLLLPESSLRVGVCSGGTGLALWLTGGLILYKNLSSLPPKKTQPDLPGTNSV